MNPSSITPNYFPEEDDLPKEIKDFLSSLPRAEGYFLKNSYQYQGHWYPFTTLLATIACQKHFEAHDTDIFLVSLPKGGTTWLKALAFATVNRDRFPYTNHPLLTKNPHDLILYLELGLYYDNNIPDLTHFTEPRLFASHLPCISLPQSIKNSQCKIIYVCRNPKDAFISGWHFYNKLMPSSIGLDAAFDMFSKGVDNYGPCWDHILGYRKESLEKPEKILFLTYEEIKREPAVQLRRLAKFLGHPFSTEEEKSGVVDEIVKMCSFQNLSSLEVNKTGKLYSGVETSSFFRKGDVGDSVNYLTAEMAEAIDRLTEQKFDHTDLKF